MHWLLGLVLNLPLYTHLRAATSFPFGPAIVPHPYSWYHYYSSVVASSLARYRFDGCIRLLVVRGLFCCILPRVRTSKESKSGKMVQVSSSESRQGKCHHIGREVGLLHRSGSSLVDNDVVSGVSPAAEAAATLGSPPTASCKPASIATSRLSPPNSNPTAIQHRGQRHG